MNNITISLQCQCECGECLVSTSASSDEAWRVRANRELLPEHFISGVDLFCLFLFPSITLSHGHPHMPYTNITEPWIRDDEGEMTLSEYKVAAT